ncbi:Rap1 GTPase-GDP dissociation stimulator 1 [Coemansia sp. S610]|nr:Rap1 GTPase-GDP dissociation stimulator 1 [Coemansia sp. S610]
MANSAPPAQTSDDELLASLLHSTQSPAATARAFKALADQCQDAETRLRLTEQPLLAQALSAVLQRTLADLSEPEELSEPERADRMLLLVQTLRCMGNASADNSGGRAQLLEHGGVTGIARVLSGVAEVLSEPLLMRAAFGAALNAALDTADNARALIAGGALEPHLRALSVGPPCDAWAVVCMSLDSLCESDKAVAAFEQDAACMASVLGTLGALARVEGPLARGAMRTLVWVLCETVEKSAAVRIQLCTPDAVLALFDLLEFYLETAPEEDVGVSAPAPPNRPLPAGNRYADAVTQAIVGVSGEDAALAALFPSRALLSRLMDVLASRGGDSARADGMAAAAALCLGNLARSDEHCVALVDGHAGVVRALVGDWLAPGVSVRTRHAASGVLKNLSLAQANRAPLAAMGLAGVAAAGVTSAVVPVQANCIGILRHLAAVPACVAEMVRGSALPDVLRVVRESDVDAIRCEGTRLVAALAKRVFLANDDLRAAVVGHDLVTPLARLVVMDGERHPLLRQESLVALTVVAAAEPRYASDVLALLAPGDSAPLGRPDDKPFAEVLAMLVRSESEEPLMRASAQQARSLVQQLATHSKDGVLDALL